MATSKRLNIVQAHQVLGDAMAALAVCQNSFETAGFLSTRLRTGHDMLEFDAGLKMDFEDDIIRFGLIGLAYSGYVVAWERYRKIVDIDPTNFTEASVMFGLDKYSGQSGQSNFEADYPSARVISWMSSGQSFWFASVLRNSIAHGQITSLHARKVLDEDDRDPEPSYQAYVTDLRHGIVTLYNVTNSGLKNFTVQMQFDDFFKLIVTALDSFMQHIVDASHMLNLRAVLQYSPFLDEERWIKIPTNPHP